mgnify:FL=1
MDIVTYLQKTIQERRAEISETLMSSGVGDMSQYQNFMGQVSALAFMEQTLSKIKTNMETLDDD